MAAGGQTGRFGGAGYDTDLAALLAVDVDLTPLDKGLNEARRRTSQSLDIMGRDADRFSRSSRFAFQNVAFQVQDFAVQVAGGQGAMRAMAQNLPQLLGGFGLWGAAIGAVVAILGGFGQALVESSGRAGDLDKVLDDVGDRLGELLERYRAATDAARDFAGAQLEAAAQGDLRGLLERQQEALDDYRRSLEALRQVGTPGAIGAEAIRIDPEAQGALRQLVEGFESGATTAVEFRRELEALAQSQGGAAADALREMGDAAIVAGANVQRLREAVEELRSGIRVGGLETLRQKVVELRNALEIARLPEELRAMAEAASKIGVDLSTGGLESLSGEAQELLRTIADLAPQVEAQKRAHSEAESAAKRQANALKELASQIDATRAQTEATRAGGLFGGKEAAAQVKDLATAAERLGFTIDTLAEAPPIIRETVQQFVEERAALREIEQGHEAIRRALVRSNRAARESIERQRKQQEDLLRDRQRERSGELREREGRIESGGRLPDEIDAANIAARELSTTLLDLENLTFDGLIQALGRVGVQLAEQIIQALIFQAIMAAIGASTGVPVGSIAGASTGSAFSGATVSAIPGRQHGGSVFRGMPYWVGERGRELMVPETGGRVVSNSELQQMSAGGAGPTTVYNIDARQAAPGTASTIANMIQRIAPGATVNARARGRIRDRPAF